MISRPPKTPSARKSATAAALAPVLLPRAHSVRPGQEHLFPPVAHLLNAESHAVRARQLQGLPDVLVLSHSRELVQACRDAGFRAGADFLAVREAALCARRLRSGLLPSDIEDQLAYWRAYMASLAAMESAP